MSASIQLGAEVVIAEVGIREVVRLGDSYFAKKDDDHLIQVLFNGTWTDLGTLLRYDPQQPVRRLEPRTFLPENPTSNPHYRPFLHAQIDGGRGNTTRSILAGILFAGIIVAALVAISLATR